MLNAFSAFCNVNPFLGFVIIMDVAFVCTCIVGATYYGFKYFLKSLTVIWHGYPPIYCNSLGEHIPLEEELEESEADG